MSSRPLIRSPRRPLFAERTLRNISPGSRGSLRLDVGRANDLGPLVSFMGDQLAEFGGRKHKRRASQFGESRLDLGIGEASVGAPARPQPDLTFLGELAGIAQQVEQCVP